MNVLRATVSGIVLALAFAAGGEDGKGGEENLMSCRHAGVYSSYDYACRVNDYLSNEIKAHVREANDSVILVRESDLKKAREVFLGGTHTPSDDDKPGTSRKKWVILTHMTRSVNDVLAKSLHKLADNKIDFKFLFIDRYYDVLVHEQDYDKALQLMRRNNMDRGRLEKSLVIEELLAKNNNIIPSGEEVSKARRAKFGGFLLPKSELEALSEKESDKITQYLENFE